MTSYRFLNFRRYRNRVLYLNTGLDRERTGKTDYHPIIIRFLPMYFVGDVHFKKNVYSLKSTDFYLTRLDFHCSTSDRTGLIRITTFRKNEFFSSSGPQFGSPVPHVDNLVENVRGSLVRFF